MTSNELEYLKLLLTKKGRRQEKRFLAEGVRLLEESLKHRRTPEHIFYAESSLDDRARKLIDSFKVKKIALQAVKEREIHMISDSRNSQGVVGMFVIPDFNLKRVADRKDRRLLILDNIADPGNAGTLIRSAAAFGFGAVMMTDNSVEPFNAKVIRATAGAIFSLPVLVVNYEEIEYIKNRLKYYFVGGSLKGKLIGQGSRELFKASRIALLVGSEAEGLSPEFRAMTDLLLKLDHGHDVESLNAAVAGSLLMKEIYDANKASGIGLKRNIKKGNKG